MTSLQHKEGRKAGWKCQQTKTPIRGFDWSKKGGERGFDWSSKGGERGLTEKAQLGVKSPATSRDFIKIGVLPNFKWISEVARLNAFQFDEHEERQ